MSVAPLFRPELDPSTMWMVVVDNAFPGVHLTTGGSGCEGEGGDVPEEVPTDRPTRWTDQTALNIADDGGTAATELRLSLLLLLAFQLRSLSSRKSRSPPRPNVRRLLLLCPLALARRLLPSTLVTRARREQNTWQNFLIISVIQLKGLDYRRRIFLDLLSKGLNVCVPRSNSCYDSWCRQGRSIWHGLYYALSHKMIS